MRYTSEKEEYHEQLDNFARISSDAEAEKEHLIVELDSFRDTINQLNTKILHITQEGQINDEAHRRVESELRDKLSATLEELQEAYKAKDKLQMEYNGAMQKIDQQNEAIGQMKRERLELEDKLDKTDSTKSLMQKTLMGQINTLREKQKSLELELETTRNQRDKFEKEYSKLQLLETARQRTQMALSSSGSNMFSRTTPATNSSPQAAVATLQQAAPTTSNVEQQQQQMSSSRLSQAGLSSPSSYSMAKTAISQKLVNLALQSPATVLGASNSNLTSSQLLQQATYNSSSTPSKINALQQQIQLITGGSERKNPFLPAQQTSSAATRTTLPTTTNNLTASTTNFTPSARKDLRFELDSLVNTQQQSSNALNSNSTNAGKIPSLFELAGLSEYQIVAPSPQITGMSQTPFRESNL